ncbi:MAG: hypothetical protein K8W52_11020 [Deltaproteobacteria bacterium]|nr:hypothetical protein [Deltaproteobacteria bacterium]
MRFVTSFVLASLVAGCAVDKTPPTDSFTDLAGVDEKADAFSYRMKIVGSLAYGESTDSVKYTKTPRFRAVKFAGKGGDQIDVWVRGDGDAVAWVLDNSFRVIGFNDDASPDFFDSHIEVTLPASASDTHYIVFRDYDLHTAHMTVTLGATLPVNTTCTVDADCVAVPVGSCCHSGANTAINGDSVDAYATVNACLPPFPPCAPPAFTDDRVPQCNANKQCEMVAPEDIRCGGFTRNPHECAPGFACQVNQIPDIPGTCVSACVQRVLCTTTSHFDPIACMCVANG